MKTRRIENQASPGAGKKNSFVTGGVVLHHPLWGGRGGGTWMNWFWQHQGNGDDLKDNLTPGNVDRIIGQPPLDHLRSKQFLYLHQCVADCATTLSLTSKL